MKTYKNASEVKHALLNCETVKIKGWAAKINDNDEIEISAPNGEKVANDLCYLDMAVADFMKDAGMPNTTPAPVTYEKTPSGSGPLGGDIGDDTFKDPKVNTQPVTQGTPSAPDLGADTTGDKPWTDPKVNKRPEDSSKSKLPDTELGSDMSTNPTNWGESKQADSYKINFSGDTGTYASWDAAYASFKKNYRDQAAEKAANLDEPVFKVLNRLAEEAIEKVAQEGIEIPLGSGGFDSSVESEGDPSRNFSPVAEQMASELSAMLNDEGYSLEQAAQWLSSEMPQANESEVMSAVTLYINGLRPGDVDISDDQMRQMVQMFVKQAQVQPNNNPMPSESDEDDSYMLGNGEQNQLSDEEEGSVSSVAEFHSAGIVDTYAEPRREPTFHEMVLASPSEKLLRDIADPEKWAARQMLAMDEELEEEEIEEEEDDEFGSPPPSNVSASQYSSQITEAFRGKKAQDTSLIDYIKQAVSEQSMPDIDDLLSRGVQLEVIAQLAEDFGSQDVTNYVQEIKSNAPGFGAAATRIRESWGQDGTYSRDMDAETAEDLYHLTRSLGQEDSYDWSGGSQEAAVQGPEVPALPGGLAEVPVDSGTGVGFDNKMAVDEAAKSYWKDYFKEYGVQLVKDDGLKEDKKEPKKEVSDVQADRSVDDKYEPAVQEAPKPANQQKVKAQLQNAPSGAIPTPSPSSPDAPAPAPAAPGAPAPGAPPEPAVGPKPAAPAPGAGDDGLKSLGWSDQDIQAMSDEDKQKIMQIKLHKPGAGVSETGPSPKAPVKPPIDPASPGGAPGAPSPAAPSAGPTPMPINDGLASEASVDKAFAMLTTKAQAAPAMEPAAPAAAPLAAVPDPAAPEAAPAAGGEFAGAGDMAQDMSPESHALKVYNEVLEQEVKASTADQVPALKAQMLVQRLLTEVGMPINEARTLFGLTKDKGFNTLFK